MARAIVGTKVIVELGVNFNLYIALDHYVMVEDFSQMVVNASMVSKSYFAHVELRQVASAFGYGTNIPSMKNNE